MIGACLFARVCVRVRACVNVVNQHGKKAGAAKRVEYRHF